MWPTWNDSAAISYNSISDNFSTSTKYVHKMSRLSVYTGYYELVATRKCLEI